MKAISIRQPWAHLVVEGIKDVENRVRPTKHRGPLLILAVKKAPWPEDILEAQQLCKRYGYTLPTTFEIGGIIGIAEITDCVTKSKSPWFQEGDYGYLLSNARPVPFVPHRGQLGIYNVEGYDHLLEEYPPVAGRPYTVAHSPGRALKHFAQRIFQSIALMSK